MQMIPVAYTATHHHSPAPTHLDLDAMSGDILTLSGGGGRNVPKDSGYFMDLAENSLWASMNRRIAVWRSATLCAASNRTRTHPRQHQANSQQYRATGSQRLPLRFPSNDFLSTALLGEQA